MKHLQKFILLSLSTLTVLSSCQKTNPDTPVIEDPTEFTISKDSTRFNVTKASWLLPDASGFEDLYSKAVFQDGLSAESGAELVVTDMSGLEIYSNLLPSFYDDGSVIIVTNPDIAELEEIMADNDWTQMIPGNTEDVILYAFCQHGAYALNRIGEKIVIDEDKVIDLPFEDDDEDAVRSIDESYFSDGDTFVDPFKDIDFTELGYYIAPFTKWVNEHLGLTSINDDPQKDYKISFEHQHTYRLDLYVYQLSPGSDKDRIIGNLPVVARYEVQPYYVYPQQSHPEGDYYMVKANYSCEMNVPGGIFQGDDRRQQHKGLYVHICGAFLRQFDVKAYIQSGKTYSPKVTFYPTGTPKPATDINTTNYSYTTEHSVNVGVNGGGGMENKTIPGGGDPFKFLGRWEIKGHLDYGHKRSNHIAYSVRDLSVRNNSSAIGATAAWEFVCNNLPEPKSVREFTRTVPGIARSSTLLDASWIWNAATSDWCSYSAGELVTEFHPTLGACCSGVCVVKKNRAYDIGMVRVTSKLIVPKRIPFGTISFDNSFKGDTIINNIRAVYKGEHGKKEELFKSVGDFQKTVSCKCNIPEGPYEVTLDVIDASGNIKKFKSKRNITLGRRLGEDDIQHCIVSRANFEEVK